MSANATDTRGSYVSSVNIVDGRIDIVYGNRAHQEITGQTLSLTPYASLGNTTIWRCGNAPAPGGAVELTGGGVTAAHQLPGIPNRYLPATCRP